MFVVQSTHRNSLSICMRRWMHIQWTLVFLTCFACHSLQITYRNALSRQNHRSRIVFRIALLSGAMRFQLKLIGERYPITRVKKCTHWSVSIIVRLCLLPNKLIFSSSYTKYLILLNNSEKTAFFFIILQKIIG